MTAAAAPDLSLCDREPIHLLGSIQPHGFLLALDGPEGRLAHVSRNGLDLFGAAPERVLGRPLADGLPMLASAVEAASLSGAAEGPATFVRAVTVPAITGERAFDLAVHRSGDRLVLEFEEQVPDRSTLDALYPALRGFVEALQGAPTIEAMLDLLAAEIRRLTGFDRALVYRFDPGWNGTVVAEDRNEALPSYLDLRFPASDIPAQARELYRRNRIRIIPDAAYVPVPVLPAPELAAAPPLDLSFSVLRSVSPVHVEYMRNMGTAASMSISILVDGLLWGLVSCHSKAARRVALQARSACDFLTQIFAMQLAARQRAEAAERRIRLGAIQARLLGYMAEEERFTAGLLNHPAELTEMVGASGAALVIEEGVQLVGETPGEAAVQQLAILLGERRVPLFATGAAAADLPEAELGQSFAGVLAIALSEVHPSYVLWFRPELVQTVRWGGDPNKPAQTEPGAPRIHPRRSFEIWKETVRGRSAPWRPEEIEVARELRAAIVGIVLRRAEELAAVSQELRRSNKELEAFSYSVSHDLRAPFRHIVGYAELLRSKEGPTLSERGQRYVGTIIDSALTAGMLVDSLLRFSQMGRAALRFTTVDMDGLLEEVRVAVMRDQSGRNIVWKVGDLGTAHGDPTMLRLVFENLLANAVKYTRSRTRAVIEVGCRVEDAETVYWVADNGIGFDMAYVGKLFGVFQRLHRIEDYEGTGIGLANVRRIVDRHGGRTWAEGAIDRGATFYFTLPRERTPTHG